MKLFTLKTNIANAIALAGLVFAGQAFADVSVYTGGMAYSGAPTYDVQYSGTPSVNVDSKVGAISTKINGQSFLAYCADIFQSTNTGTSTYQTSSLSSVFGTTKAADLTLLADKFYSKVTNASTSAAFQIAAWSVLFGSSTASVSTDWWYGTQTLNSGKLSVGSTAYGSDSTLSTAASWLNNLHNNSVATTGNYAINLFTNTKYQDLITISAVPEADTTAMMLAGLGLLGFAARRKKASV